MNLLKTIIERLNQRVEVANIFDKQFNLCELNVNGNEKAWVHYIGNGQAEVVTNFDAKNGTLFWAKRGKVAVAKTEAYKMSGCKQLYVTTFPLTAYAIVRKSHLPCDAEDAQDWLASRVYKLTSGTDPLFKQSIGVINYEVVPSGYANEIKTLTANYEWACVSVDMDVQVITTSEDGCYDTCATGDIPLPDLQPCVPCLTEVAVDGVTITGNGTEADPLVAIGGGGGTPLITKDEGTNVSTNTSTLNFTGAGVTASLTSPGVVEVNVPGGSGVTSVGGIAPIASSGGATPDISITQADGSTDGYLSSTDWNTFDGKQDTLIAGTDISIVGTTINNTAPDQVVVLTAGADIAVSGTYPNFTIDNTAPSSGGTVTSVDLTMPSAFSVSGNPITTSGTLAVAAAGLATQYIRGDGQLANFPSNAGGGSSVTYYLNGSVAASVLGYKQMDNNAIIGGGTDFTLSGNGLIAQFLTDVGNPNRILIPSGAWNFEMYFQSSSNGGNEKFYVELLKYDGATFTSIASSSVVPEPITGGTNIDLYITSIAVPTTTLLTTDRLAIRVYIVDNAIGRTITLNTEDNTLCEIITTFAGGVSSLNGLTANTQYFATGISGSDFNINSVSDTHTFNLPTASASNRGALSTADWTTFNGKVATTRSIGTTAPLTGGGDLSADRTLAIAKATASVDGYLAATDFTTFAAKQDAINLTTTGISGAATLTGATLNIPIYGAPVVYKSVSDSASFLSTANTVVYTQLIDANTFAAGDIIRVSYRAKKIGTVGSLSLRIYANATPNLSGTPLLLGTMAQGQPASRFNQMLRHLVIKSSTNNTEVAITNFTVINDFINTGEFATVAVNWTNAIYFVFALQNNNAADTNFGSMYLIEKL